MSDDQKMLTDEEIEDRLQRLKEDIHNLNPQYEIEQRLARLTGREPNYYSANDRPIHLILPQDRGLTDDQRSDRLMQSMFQELAIDQNRENDFSTFESSTNERIDALRKFTNQLPPPKNAVQQPIIVDEQETNSSVESEQIEEWCATCNEDATVICYDCDDDKYCRECFRELHRDSDMRNHRKGPFGKM